MTVKAYGYLRVSGQGQIEGDGYTRQRQAIEQYCKASGLEIVNWYEEQETGTTQDRPELAQMMVDLELNGKEVQTVVIERLDRLARDLQFQAGAGLLAGRGVLEGHLQDIFAGLQVSGHGNPRRQEEVPAGPAV